MRGRWTGFGVVAAVLILAIPFGPAGVTPAVARPLMEPRSASSALSANATYLDMGGQWNCGSGYETFAFFGQALGGTAPYTYSWEFGDGSPSSTGRNVSHTFHNVAAYVVNFTVTDAHHGSAQTNVTPNWAVPLACGTTTDVSPVGLLIYLGLVAGVVTGLVLLWRYRRNQSV